MSGILFIVLLFLIGAPTLVEAKKHSVALADLHEALKKLNDDRLLVDWLRAQNELMAKAAALPSTTQTNLKTSQKFTPKDSESFRKVINTCKTSLKLIKTIAKKAKASDQAFQPLYADVRRLHAHFRTVNPSLEDVRECQTIILKALELLEKPVLQRPLEQGRIGATEGYAEEKMAKPLTGEKLPDSFVQTSQSLTRAPAASSLSQTVIIAQPEGTLSSLPQSGPHHDCEVELR